MTGPPIIIFFRDSKNDSAQSLKAPNPTAAKNFQPQPDF